MTVMVMSDDQSTDGIYQSKIAETPKEDLRGSESEETVWVVAANYADGPHPQVLAVYDNPGSAIEHKEAIRESIKASEPVAWMSAECEIKSESTRKRRSNIADTDR